jgi:KaiC/GvpD/RAD55 family RecA-like ATPase
MASMTDVEEPPHLAAERSEAHASRARTNGAGATGVPHDVDAESDLIVAGIHSDTALGHLVAVPVADFHSPRCQKLRELIGEYAALGARPNKADLLADLKVTNDLDRIGGELEVTKLLLREPATAAAPKLAERVRTVAVRRRLLYDLINVAHDLRTGADLASITERLESIENRAESAAPVAESWVPVDLRPLLEGDTTTPTPTVLLREDRVGLFYESAVNGIHGDSGLGKSWVIAVATKQELEAGRPVLLIDYEDRPETLIARLRALAVAPDLIAELVIYVRPTEAIAATTTATLAGLIGHLGIRLVGIDSVGEAFAVEGVNEDKDAEVAPWIRALPRALADAGGTVVLVDHATKAADNPLHPSGSKRKRAAITGISYLVEAIAPLARADGADPVTGKLRLTVAKDRHGRFRRGQTATDLELTSYPDGGVTGRLWPPTTAAADTKPLTILLAARQAAAALRDHGKPASQRVLLGLMRLRAGTETKRAGIELAVEAGAIRLEKGTNGGKAHVYVRDFDIDEEPTDDA